MLRMDEGEGGTGEIHRLYVISGDLHHAIYVISVTCSAHASLAHFLSCLVVPLSWAFHLHANFLPGTEHTRADNFNFGVRLMIIRHDKYMKTYMIKTSK